MNMEKFTVDPTFRLMRFHSMANSLFIWKIIYFLENDLESPLIFVLFLKGKQNKKENPKCDSLFGKYGLWKIEYELEGQVTYWKVQ